MRGLPNVQKEANRKRKSFDVTTCSWSQGLQLGGRLGRCGHVCHASLTRLGAVCPLSPLRVSRLSHSFGTARRSSFERGPTQSS